MHGLPVAITAALCDTALIVAAVSGVSLAVLSVGWLNKVISWVGVLFLVSMGVVTWRATPDDPASLNGDPWPVRRQLKYTLSVSLLNPHAILDTVGVLGTTSLRYPALPEKLAFTLACIGISWLWFLGLMTAGYVIGSLGPAVGLRRWLNRISALIMWGVAFQLLFQSLR